MIHRDTCWVFGMPVSVLMRGAQKQVRSGGRGSALTPLPASPILLPTSPCLFYFLHRASCSLNLFGGHIISLPTRIETLGDQGPLPLMLLLMVEGGVHRCDGNGWCSLRVDGV